MRKKRISLAGKERGGDGPITVADVWLTFLLLIAHCTTNCTAPACICRHFLYFCSFVFLYFYIFVFSLSLYFCIFVLLYFCIFLYLEFLYFCILVFLYFSFFYYLYLGLWFERKIIIIWDCDLMRAAAARNNRVSCLTVEYRAAPPPFGDIIKTNMRWHNKNKHF